MSDETYTPDKLISGTEIAAIIAACAILTGQNLARGTVLGAVTRVAPDPAVGTAGGGNAGAGTLTGVVLGRLTKLGVYTVACVAAAAGAGIFSVVDPDGERLDDAVVGVAYANDHLGFTLNDGNPDFSVGDTFTIEVAAGSGKCKKLDKTAVDGSQRPVGILAEAVDATAADKPGVRYETGIFNPEALILAAGTTVADIEADLLARGLRLRDLRTL